MLILAPMVIQLVTYYVESKVKVSRAIGFIESYGKGNRDHDLDSYLLGRNETCLSRTCCSAV